jgi:DNA-3-methyladenine glycosylase
MIEDAAKIKTRLDRLKKFSDRDKLPRAFYRRNTETVARDLLGKLLVHQTGRKRLSGIIVETEAYMGTDDAACHTFGGRRSAKNESMFQDGGISYVYQIYGMYYCLNTVTRTKDCPEAVLIRAVQPCEGIKQMMINRSFKTKVKKERDLANGPGKLCIALGIDRQQDGLPLDGSELYIEDKGFQLKRSQIIAGPRIGVDYAGAAAEWHLRFYIKGNDFVSRT